ncbi:hypothetical protein D1007_33353 [Hordeum vulgare]|nr:hypothetical protein D1007_33353 [Hordeum vulgare]
MIRFMAQMPFEMGVSSAAAISGDASPELILFSDRCYEQYTASPGSDHVHLNELEFLFVWFGWPWAPASAPMQRRQKGVVTPLPFDRLHCQAIPCAQPVYYMDTDDHELEPVKSIGGRAIFVGCRRCLSVNAHKFSSIVPDCVYYLLSSHTINGRESQLAVERRERRRLELESQIEMQMLEIESLAEMERLRNERQDGSHC